MRPRNDLTDLQEAVLALHEATLLGLDPESDDDALEQSCQLADEGLEALGPVEPSASLDALYAEGHRARARALVRLSRGAAALEAAREAVVRVANAQSHAVLAEVLRATGDDDGAARSRSEALELAHPESLLAQQLSRSAAGPFR